MDICDFGLNLFQLMTIRNTSKYTDRTVWNYESNLAIRHNTLFNSQLRVVALRLNTTLIHS